MKLLIAISLFGMIAATCHQTSGRNLQGDTVWYYDYNDNTGHCAFIKQFPGTHNYQVEVFATTPHKFPMFRELSEAFKFAEEYCPTK